MRRQTNLHVVWIPTSLKTNSYKFALEGGAPFTRDSFNWMVKRAGKKARVPFQVHADMIRHATG